MPVTEGGWFVPKWCNDLMFSGHISSQAIMLVFVCLSHVPVVLKVRNPRKRTRPKSTGREERRDRPKCGKRNRTSAGAGTRGEGGQHVA